MNLLSELRSLFEPALLAVGADPAKVPDYLGMVKPSADAKHGDYQANFAMPLAKVLGKKPQEVAKEVIDATPTDGMIEPPTVAGPGFINLKLTDAWIAEQVQAIAKYPDLGVAKAETPKTFVIDYSGPNVAKPLHVGHLRSTIIGDALVRLLRFLGHTVIGDNHLGDWGTQFGILIYGYKHHLDQAAFDADPVRELARLYIHVRNLAKVTGDEDEGGGEVMEACRQETAKLHAGDPENVRLWKQFMPACLEMLRPIYDRLDVKIDHALGESFYNPMLAGVVDDLLAKGIAVESNGAVVVPNASGFVLPYEEKQIHELGKQAAGGSGAYTDAADPVAELEKNFLIHASVVALADSQIGRDLAYRVARGSLAACTPDQRTQLKKRIEKRAASSADPGVHKALQLLSNEVNEPPALVRKRDGAFTYTATDMATIKYRIITWKPDIILYVVDARQSLHFKTLFANAMRWGMSNTEFQHIAFGTILGKDKKPIRTRDGGTVELASLLDEAAELGLKRYEESHNERKAHGHDVPDLTDETKRLIAEAVGIGAVKYGDLSGNRTSDYVFDFDRMLATEGNTATYMQYAYARCRAIFRKGNVDDAGFRTSPPPVRLTHPAERALAVQLLKFEEVLSAAAAEYLPHYITQYLWDVAKAFSGFFEGCPVLTAPNEELKQSRLLLVDLTARTIQTALGLLGIRTVERM